MRAWMDNLCEYIYAAVLRLWSYFHWMFPIFNKFKQDSTYFFPYSRAYVIVYPDSFH